LRYGRLGFHPFRDLRGRGRERCQKG
jgi:hypothetical protein